MPPKADEPFSSAKPTTTGTVNNKTLIPDAGKVHLDEAQSCGRGFCADIKRTVGSHWVEEMINFNQKTVAVTMLMFISVVAPTLTFGAVYGKVTKSQIGAVETILATAWVGIAYSLFGGMPTCIIGSTGPILIMTTVLYDMSQNMDIPFLPFYAWVSIWLFIYAAISAFFDLTRYVRLATRFTDEIFALLIVSIFVMDALGDPFSNVGILRYLSPKHPSHGEYEGDAEDYSYLETAFLSIILGFGTTSTIFLFRHFRNTSFFCNQSIRVSIHDFAVTFAVLIWTMVQQLGFPTVEIEGLKVPSKFEPTYACCTSSCETFWPDECPDEPASARTRNWFVNYSDLNGKGWVPIMAAGPAILAFGLLFLDNGITWHLIYHKSHNLQHGEAYNYDLFLSGCFNMINGMLGLPWLVATTVPCIIHLNALADKDKDGKFLYVQETRLTYLFSHLLLGLSLLFLDVLKLIPLPVLYGVFLFMGLSSLPNIQFWNRFLLFFQQPSIYPETVYTKYMAKSNIHKYTCIQLFFFACVFVVQNVREIAIAFPLMTLLCIPGRIYLLPKFLEGWELLLLDGEDEKIAEWIAAKESAVRHIEFGFGNSMHPVSSSQDEVDEEFAEEAEDASQSV